MSVTAMHRGRDAAARRRATARKRAWARYDRWLKEEHDAYEKMLIARETGEGVKVAEGRWKRILGEMPSMKELR